MSEESKRFLFMLVVQVSQQDTCHRKGCHAVEEQKGLRGDSLSREGVEQGEAPDDGQRDGMVEVAGATAGTLHLAPLAIGDRFAAAIILPRGTNSPLAGGISGTLRAVNKWLLVHPDNEAGIAAGGKVGVTGANITLTGYDGE